MNNYTCIKKRIQEMMIAYKLMNNKNTHACMQAAVNMMFTHMHVKRVIKLFGERSISEMIKEFRQLDEGAMPVNPVVIPINPDELTDADIIQALEALILLK